MTPTCPGPTLGVVGGGQLGRMLAEAASPLGVDVVVLDPTPNCPASRVADQVEGTFDDANAVRALAERADALTLEIELADPDVLEAAGAEYGVPVHPSPDALRTIQDKLVQNRAFEDADVPVPEFVRVDDADDLADAVERFGGAAMLKARTGGYDGRGTLLVEAGDDYEAALWEVGAGDGSARGVRESRSDSRANRNATRSDDGTGDAAEVGALAEELVPFEREVAVIGVRGDDEVRTFPLTETVHEAEIMRETVVPARTDDAVAERAREVARDALGVLDGRGTFGIELFEVEGGEVLLNEVAPRPHNSGHWTIEGATASQFEQHVRAVLGWPLALAEARAPTVTTNLLGDVSEPGEARLRGVEHALSAPNAHVHWYGKREVRRLRKMGHVTLTDADSDADDLLAEARDLRGELTFQ